MARGGARAGSGRKPGSPNARSALEAIKAVAEAHPGWHPLLQMAEVANDDTLPVETRMDAAKAAARYMVPPPKPVELEPDALVALERRLARIRLEAALELRVQDPGLASLADRLERAAGREIYVVTGVPRAPDEPVDVTPTRAPSPAKEAPAPEPAPLQASPVIYEPILPSKQRTSLMAENYNPYSEDTK